MPYAALAALLLAAAAPAPALTLKPQPLSVDGNDVTLMVPNGMWVEFVAPINNARFLTLGPDNELIIGSNGSSVYRLPLPYTNPSLLVNLGSRSHSAAYRNGKLYVADTGGVLEADYGGLGTSLAAGDFDELVDLPTGGHSSRTVLAAPDGTLYVSIGISGNCSDEYLAGTLPDYPAADRRGGVWRIDESGADATLVPYSSGLRNPIGIAVHPESGELWATNAGSDNLGYHQPREVFSRLSNGSWHGMPWFQYVSGSFQSQGCIDSDPPRPAAQATAPSATFDARSTPMGIAFVQGNVLGNAFAGNALVAVHGSWAVDSSQGGGPETRRHPKVVMVHFSGNNPTGVVEDVITGFQRPDGSRFARPSGAILTPNGHFYFTSDGGDVEGLFRLIPIPDTGQPPSGDTANHVPYMLLLD